MDGVEPLGRAGPARLGGYELLGVLGRGGQGVVYLGRSPTGQMAAVKVLHAHLSGDADAQRRFLREVETARQVAEFSTARVLDAGLDGGRPYVVSEYVRGESLEELIRREGPRDAGGLHRLAMGTAAALAAIHRAGIVHRDFKPGNVLLGADGIRVVDFGIARALDSAATMSSGILGTPAYMAPEQVTGQQVGPAADLFAWAATMVYAATGHAAFGSDTVPAVFNRVLHIAPDLSAVPPSLRPVLERCLAKRPKHRPTAQEVLMTLVGSGQPPPGFLPPVTLPSYPPPQPRPSRSNAGIVVAACVGVVLLLAGIGGAALLVQSRTPAATATPVAEPKETGFEETEPEETAPKEATVAGTWKGVYVCGQGATALKLTVTQTDSGALKATFAFAADPSNPDVPSGSFAMVGLYADGVLDLRASKWIDRPQDYVMVDLHAKVTGDRPSRLEGSVEGSGCSTFSVRRT